MNKITYNNLEKIQQNLSLNLNIQSQSDKYQIISLKIEIYEAKIDNIIDINDLNPYVLIMLGKDQQKTATSKSIKTNSFMFNEMFEFKKINEIKMIISLYHKTSLFSKDKFIGGRIIDLLDPNILNISYITLANENQQIIGILNLKIRATEITKMNTLIQENDNKRKFHTDNTLVTIQNAESYNNSLDLSNDFIQKFNQFDRAYITSNNIIPSHSQRKELRHKIKFSNKKTINDSYNKSIPKLENKNSKNKLDECKKDGDNIVTARSETETLRLDDIEKVKFDLNEEKHKIRAQEKRLNKIMGKFKKKQIKLEEEKKVIQQRKDLLTIQERSLLEEKNQWNEQLNSLKQEKYRHEEQKTKLLNEIESLQQNVIIIKMKNSIHAQKLNNLLKLLPDLKARKAYVLSQFSTSNRLKKANSLFKKNLNTFPHVTDEEFENQDFLTYRINPFQTISFGVPGHKKNLIKSHSWEIWKKRPQIKKENLIFELKAEKNRIVTLESQLKELKKQEQELESKVNQRKKPNTEMSLRIGRSSEKKQPKQNLSAKNKKTGISRVVNGLDKSPNGYMNNPKVTEFKINDVGIKSEYHIVDEKQTEPNIFPYKITFPRISAESRKDNLIFDNKMKRSIIQNDKNTKSNINNENNTYTIQKNIININNTKSINQDNSIFTFNNGIQSFSSSEFNNTNITNFNNSILAYSIIGSQKNDDNVNLNFVKKKN